MANRADPAWEKFFQYFFTYDGTPAQIAARFNEGETVPIVTPAQVRDWRRRHTRPSLSDLPELSYHWEGDQLFFARLLGAVPSEGLGAELYAQKRILELTHEVQALEGQVRAADTTAATGRIVAAATSTGRWAVAAHPAIEGPTGVPIHVADRLTFRHVGPRVLDGETLRDALEEDLADAFHQNHVVFAPYAKTVWQQGLDHAPLSYSVAHTVSPFGPSRMWSHAGVESISVVSTTLGTWVFDVAAIVARMIGYGFVNTRGLSQWRRPSSRQTTQADLWGYRTEAHQDLLARPWPRYVWAHVGEWNQPAGDRFLSRDAVPPHVTLIWLRESDSLIDGLARGAEASGVAPAKDYRASLLARHQEMEAAIEGGQAIHTIECETAEAGEDGLRTPRWDRTFAIAAQIVTQLLAAGSVDPSALTRSLQKLAGPPSADPINGAVVEWLRTTTWLAEWGVNPTHLHG